MAWCPFAVHKPLRENTQQGHIVPRAIVLHTAVSSAASLFDFFQNGSDLESHFYVNELGVIEQYLDTTVRADANLNANAFAVSIETWDGRTIREWNPAQVEALVRLLDWLCGVHGIPRKQIQSATGSGIGWHVMFGAPGPWTPVSKSCPGAPRIAQTKNVIIPRVAAGNVPTAPVPPANDYEEEDPLSQLPAAPEGRKESFGRPRVDKHMRMYLGSGFGGTVQGKLWAYEAGGRRVSTGVDGAWEVKIDPDKPKYVLIPAGVVQLSFLYTCKESVSVTWAYNEGDKL